MHNLSQIAIDLDGVVFDTGGWLKKHWRAHLGRTIDESVYDFGDHDTMRRALETFHRTGVAEAKAIRGAQRVIKQLVVEQVDIFFVSSRPFRCWDATAKALESLGLTVRGRLADAQLILVDDADKVAETIALFTAPMDRCLLLDDRFSTVVKAAEVGLPAILFDQPWNRKFSATPLPRAMGWLGRDSVADALELT